MTTFARRSFEITMFIFRSYQRYQQENVADKTGLKSMLALSIVTISEQKATKGTDIDWGDEKVTLRDQEHLFSYSTVNFLMAKTVFRHKKVGEQRKHYDADNSNVTS